MEYLLLVRKYPTVDKGNQVFSKSITKREGYKPSKKRTTECWLTITISDLLDSITSYNWNVEVSFFESKLSTMR